MWFWKTKQSSIDPVENRDQADSKLEQSQPINYNKEPTKADYFFHKAIYESCKISVRMCEPEFNGATFVGSCVDFTDKSFTLSLGDATVSKEWLQYKVYVFFQLSSKEQDRFCNFYGEIVQINPSNNDLQVVISRPSTLNHEQRRQFLRLVPSLKMVEKIEFWRSPLNQGVAAFTIIPAELFVLNDISAVGVNIAIKQEYSNYEEMGIGDIILCRLQFKFGKPEELITLILAGNTMRMMPTGKSKILGIRFKRWSKYNPLTKDHAWQPVNNQDGIGILAHWIMNHHYQQNKFIKHGS